MTHEELMMGVSAPAVQELYTPTGGLYAQPDTAPYTGTTLATPMAGLYDADYTKIGGLYWQPDFSFALDLGTAKPVAFLTVYLEVSQGGAGGWWAGYEGNQMDVYKSDDNANWTLVQQNDGPTLSHINGDLCRAILTLPEPAPEARYFKVVNSDPNELTSLVGYSYGICELEALSP